MSALKISPEDQIQRVNHLLNQVRTLQSLDDSTLQFQEEEKWNLIQVIEHLNLAYLDYKPKFDKTVPLLQHSKREEAYFLVRGIKKIFIQGQKPKEGKRRFKMKTFKKMDPQSAKNSSEIKAVFDRFDQYYGELKAHIIACRGKHMKQLKITSAIGPLLKFYLPEAFEFLLAHAERHWAQIEELKKAIPQKITS